MCSLSIHIYSLEKRLFKSFAHFTSKTRIFVFLLLGCKSPLCSPDTRLYQVHGWQEHFLSLCNPDPTSLQAASGSTLPRSSGHLWGPAWQGRAPVRLWPQEMPLCHGFMSHQGCANL